MPIDIAAAHHYDQGTPVAPRNSSGTIFSCVPNWETEVYLDNQPTSSSYPQCDAGACKSGDDDCAPTLCSTSDSTDPGCVRSAPAAFTLARQISDFMADGGGTADLSAYHYFLLVNYEGTSGISGVAQPYSLSVEDSSGSLTLAQYAYALGQYSRFVRPGWSHILASATGFPAGLSAKAFMDPTGADFAVVFVNTTADWQVVTLALTGLSAPSGTRNWDTSSQNGYATQSLYSPGTYQSVGSQVWIYPSSVQTVVNF